MPSTPSVPMERGRNSTASGVRLVADTCIVVAPILPAGGGVLMTNSGKFAHYTLPNTGYDVVFGTTEDCVETAVTGRLGEGGSFAR